VITKGVDSPLAGVFGAHPARNTARIRVKAIRFFISASFSSGLT